MATILCLAHYCDTHGPTPLMVTEGLPVGCTSCFGDEEPNSRRPSTSSRSLNPSDGLAGMARGGSRANLTSDMENGAQRATLQTQTSKDQSAIETPPESPRVAALQGGSSSHARRDSSFRKTYDENDKKRAIPCENCALTLPKKTKEDFSAAGQIDHNGGPILRTKLPYERVSASTPADERSPPKSSASSSSDSEPAIKSHNHTRPLIRATTSSSNSSFNSITSHDHSIDYVSTHEPLAPTSFSIIRQSCLRTLSCETLPPSSTQNTTTSPTSPLTNPFSSSSSTSTSTSSGGPIFFGDPLAGYTTAYIFRIPDPNARGRRRVYALMALSTHRQRLAMKTFDALTIAFRNLAAWIQGLAEAELERCESPRGVGISEGGSNYNTPTSSFLSGRNRGPDGKFAGMSLRARGLADLVGQPDFFFELHKRFVWLLIELSVVLGV
ncbi:hypothetical protein LCER1_G003595 [Lachnellula cervina]|uniref:UDENN FLCN/SMCR8-type domain-containing protein n=1 Tax=Lachnellula cervina TaxID=1316786 RepID=A0A7D8URT1_9HELO|nr:hypothetical protein LCER1_G003595 [Lachnellula cervina]